MHGLNKRSVVHHHNDDSPDASTTTGCNRTFTSAYRANAIIGTYIL